MTYIKTFVKEILKYSNSNDYDSAIKEWIAYGEESKGPEVSCICGHWIIINCKVINTKNKNVLTVGNCCINKFGIKKQHFNGTKLNYIEFCITKCNNKWDRDFCNKVKKQIENGYMFYASQLKKLEQISGQKSRFKSFENSSKHRNWVNNYKSD